VGGRRSPDGAPELTALSQRYASPLTAAAVPQPRHWAERAALRYLMERGFRPLAVNYRLRGGELDLVLAAPAAAADSPATVVVVEVRQRRSDAYGHPAETLNTRKLRALRATALHFVTFALRRPSMALRLDAVLISGDERHHRIDHLEGIG